MLAAYLVSFLEEEHLDPAGVGRLVTICVRFLAGSSCLFPAWNIMECNSDVYSITIIWMIALHCLNV